MLMTHCREHAVHKARTKAKNWVTFCSLSAHAHTNVEELFQEDNSSRRTSRSFRWPVNLAPKAALGGRTGGKLGGKLDKHSGLGQRRAHCYTGINVIVIISCASPLAAISTID